MKIAKLLIPGRFENAFAYMGRLITVTEDRAMQIYNLESIANFIETKYSVTLPTPTYMFSRNDWFSSPQFKTLMQNEAIAKDLYAAFDRFPQPFLDWTEISHLDSKISRPELQKPLAINDTAILDMSVYNNRIYIGTTDSLLHLDVEIPQGATAKVQEPQKRLEVGCVNIAVKYGAANASCGSDGLFTLINDFSWRPEVVRRTEHIESGSLRTGWLDYGFVNYPALNEPYLFKFQSEKARQNSNLERESRVLTEVNLDAESFTDYLPGNVKESDFVDNTQYSYNSNNSFFVRTNAGKFYSYKIKKSRDASTSILPNSIPEKSISRIVSVNPTKVGPVIETSNRIVILSNETGQLEVLHDGRAIAIKTFPQSKRFQHLVAITIDEGVLLVSLFDEAAFTTPNGANGFSNNSHQYADLRF